MSLYLQCYRVAHFQPSPVATDIEDALSSTPDALLGTQNMTRAPVSFCGDTRQQPDQTSPRLGVRSPKQEPVGPLSFHYFGPAAGYKRPDASTDTTPRGSRTGASLSDATAPRDAIVRVQLLHGVPPVTNEAVAAGDEQAAGSSNGTGRSIPQAERSSTCECQGDAGDMLLPPPPAITVGNTPPCASRSATTTPHANHQPRSHSTGACGMPQASGAMPWYGESNVVSHSELPSPSHNACQ